MLIASLLKNCRSMKRVSFSGLRIDGSRRVRSLSSFDSNCRRGNHGSHSDTPIIPRGTTACVDEPVQQLSPALQESSESSAGDAMSIENYVACPRWGQSSSNGRRRSSSGIHTSDPIVIGQLALHRASVQSPHVARRPWSGCYFRHFYAKAALPTRFRDSHKTTATATHI